MTHIRHPGLGKAPKHVLIVDQGHVQRILEVRRALGPEFITERLDALRGARA